MTDLRLHALVSLPDSEESVRAEARGVLGDFFFKALSVLLYLLVPALVALAICVARSGTYSVIAAALITAAATLLPFGHKPWQHALRRRKARAAARERLRSARQERRRWRR
ncbi:hypothetical protein ABT368_31685 [Streptomyces althioticus]|uniref:hypothetical protein n=1 Tax=Streptomyces althioticus TaxID=83380 RepID=UPI001385311E|nr:hypothetical protein [Streptomyces sp. SID6013]WTB51636.1 hypothetical protein OG968_35945 [Streptomyces althioticus]GGT78975.1 hypothetical protein GCM10010243_66710 [Streptomyces matensis]